MDTERVWSVVDYSPDGPVYEEWTDQDILDFYWEYWSAEMKRIGFGEDLITPRMCIEDWVTVNWAVEVKET